MRKIDGTLKTCAIITTIPRTTIEESGLYFIHNEFNTINMKKNIMLGALALSIILYGYFVLTGEGAVLPFVLIGLLVSFVCAMLYLTKK